VEMRKCGSLGAGGVFRSQLGAGLLALLLAAGASEAKGVELPAPLRDVQPELRPIGTATLHWFGLHVYDVALFAQEPPFTTNSTAVLSIRYNMAVKRSRLLEITLKEWRKIGTSQEAQRAQWIKQLEAVWPDLKSGDSLTAFRRQGGPTQFYFGDRLLGEVPDPAFGPAFFAIWLDANCSYPEVRDRLLGVKKETKKGR
jgi:hypothetical protein